VLNQLVEHVTTKAVAVTVVAVIVVAVVPVTVLSVAPGDDSVGRTPTGPASHARTNSVPTAKKVPPRVKFQSDADDLIAALRGAEAGCVASITGVITSSGHPAGQTQPILDAARKRLDGTVQPLVARVQRDETDVARARLLTRQQLDTYVADIDTIRLMALPTTTNKGSIANLCSTLVAQVQQQVAALPRPTDGGDGGDGGD
jgi:hypothetical protein